MHEIMDMCSPSPDDRSQISVTEQQVSEAIEHHNGGKAADFHGMTTEHFLYGWNDLLRLTAAIINQIFRFGRVKEALRNGTLTPVFKHKGSATDAKTYRVVTIWPTITKITETTTQQNPASWQMT